MTTLLAGDIGGTKTLLAIYGLEGDRLSQQRAERFVSADWAGFRRAGEPLPGRRACH